MAKFDTLGLIKSLKKDDLDLIIDSLNDCRMISTIEEPLATYYLIAKNWNSSCGDYLRSKGCKDEEIICRMVKVDEDTDQEDSIYVLSSGYITSQQLIEHIELLRP